MVGNWRPAFSCCPTSSMKRAQTDESDSGYGSEASSAWGSEASYRPETPPPAVKRRRRKQAAPQKKIKKICQAAPPPPQLPPQQQQEPQLLPIRKKTSPPSPPPPRRPRRIKPTPVAQGPRQGLLHKLLHAYFSATTTTDRPTTSRTTWARKLVKKAHGAAEKYLAEADPPQEEDT